MHDFSVWLRTGSNPADINRFEAILGEKLLCNLPAHVYESLNVLGYGLDFL